MITRSSAKAKLEFSRAVGRERRQERLRKLASRGGPATPYNLRSIMERRTGKSSQSSVKQEVGDGDAFDDGEVQPVKLAFLDEEVCSPRKSTTTEVSNDDFSSSYSSQTIDFISDFLYTY